MPSEKSTENAKSLTRSDERLGVREVSPPNEENDSVGSEEEMRGDRNTKLLTKSLLRKLDTRSVHQPPPTSL